MLKDLEFLARKQEQISNRALQLQHENQVMQQQIMQHLQNSEQQQRQNQLLFEENQRLKMQLEYLKKNLKDLSLAAEENALTDFSPHSQPTQTTTDLQKNSAPNHELSAKVALSNQQGMYMMSDSHNHDDHNHEDNTWASNQEFEDALTKEIEEKLKQALQENTLPMPAATLQATTDHQMQEDLTMPHHINTHQQPESLNEAVLLSSQLMPAQFVEHS